MMNQETEPISRTNPKRQIGKAFVIGAVVHAILLAASLSGPLGWATWLLLVFAFPGAIVDMSSEMVHPSQTGGVLLAIVATFVNGGAYALGAWLLAKIRRRLGSKNGG